MLDSGCELARPINTIRNVFVLKALLHLDMLPLAVGVVVAVVVAIMFPIIAPAILGMLGFSALGPAAGKSSLLVDPTRDVKTNHSHELNGTLH